tara:strand:- start:156 stop:1073 length:918 start_codon:yes stop_codon:yes gene_type:complete
MITHEICNLFESGGACIDAKYNNKNIKKLNYNKIVSIFEQKGIILFKNYSIDPKNLNQITDRFTETYAVDAERRKQRFDKKIIRNVDLGEKDILLHSEASFAPAWPEIIWFYCITPPKSGGTTTLCDGVKLWKSLSYDTKDFFLLNPINFQLKIQIDKKKTTHNNPKRKWMIGNVGSGNGLVDWRKGILKLSLNRFAVHEGRKSNELCFANHLLIKLNSESQLIKRRMLNGKKIPNYLMNEIRKKSEKITYDHSWRSGDLLMIDNKRFMHGRRAYKKNDPRDIVNLQTSRASFGYGGTLRKKIKT